MNPRKPKSEIDRDLDEALRETFPGSDPIAVDAVEDKPVRPIGRRPPVILPDATARQPRKPKDKTGR